MRWFETDVRASADGVAVLHHDRTLRRLFGIDAAVADLTWERLRPLRTPAGDRLARPVDARWAHVPDRLLGAGVLTAGVVARAADLGQHVMAWTVDRPARMHQLLDMGVRGIITDRPDLLREVLVARGSWRRPEVHPREPERGLNEPGPGCREPGPGRPELAGRSDREPAPT